MSRRKSHKLMTLIAGASLVAVAAAGAAQASSAPAASGGGGELVDLGTFVARPARAHRSGAEHHARRLSGHQRHVRRPHRHRLDRSGQPQGRARPRRLLGRTTTPRCGPSRSTPTRRSATASRSCRARSSARGSGRPTRTSPATTATCSTSSRAAPRSSPATADTLTGVVADDDAMTLTVTLSAPYVELPRGGRLPALLPDARGGGRRRPRLREPADDRQRPVHDGVAAHRRGDRPRQERRLGRRLQRQHLGPAARPHRVPRVGRRRHVVQRVRGRRGRHRPHPVRPHRRGGGQLGHHHRHADHGLVLLPDQRPTTRAIGGPENLKLRQAISQAIDRDAINDAVYDGAARPADRHRDAEGIPGFKPDLCEYCTYDPDAAQAAFDEWTAAGNVQSEPIPIQFEPAACTVTSSSWSSTTWPPSASRPSPTSATATTYFSAMADGACVHLPRGLDRRLPDVRQLHVQPVRHRVDRRQQLRLQQPGVRRPRRRRPSRPSTRPSRRRCSTRPRTSC